MDETLAEKNRHLFNKHASHHHDGHTGVGGPIQSVIHELQTRREWIDSRLADGKTESSTKPKLRLLDYACGSGTVSMALSEYVDELVGLDLAENMVANYNKAATHMGLTTDQMHAYQGNLLEEGNSIPNLKDFDIVVISMALHHVSDPEELLKRLSKVMRAGGVCVVLDMAPGAIEAAESGDPRGMSEALHTIHKRGFTSEEMSALFEAAGLGNNFQYIRTDMPVQLIRGGKAVQIPAFIARGELVKV